MMAPMSVMKCPGKMEKNGRRLLEKVRLGSLTDRYPTHISGGHTNEPESPTSGDDPTVMLYGEPTSALEPELVEEVLKLKKDPDADSTTHRRGV